MNRMFWGIALLVLVAAGGWAQSTWRGQAEVWTTADAPTEGFLAASNEFPKNSLLTVENYKTRKTIQVRVVSTLPAGATAFILLNARAAQALEIKAGEIPLVGVRIDPTGIDRADNPDPDVNPLASRTERAPAVASTPPSAVTPAVPVATATTTPAPTLAPEAQDTTARTPAVTSLEVARSSTALDPDLLPLPALADPEPVAETEPTPLVVTEEPEPEAPVTPGRRVFVTTRDPEPVASDAPVTETPPTETPVAEEPIEPEPEVLEPEPEVAVAPEVVEAVEPEAEPVPEPEPLPEVVETPALVEAPVEEVPVAVAPVVDAPVVEAPMVAPPVLVAPAPAAPVPPKVSSTAWVAEPGKLEGPILGAVPVLASLEKGRSYVQVGAWASEADLLVALSTIKTHVPLALYKAEGEKNPWRVVVAAAPKGQLGVLLMHYRSQGFRTAGVVKG